MTRSATSVCPPIPVEERYVISDRWEMDDLRHTGGMGLWLVYWVANRSGGDLTFDTHADGNVVTVTVPNAKCDAIDEGSLGASPSNRRGDRRRGAVGHVNANGRVRAVGFRGPRL